MLHQTTGYDDMKIEHVAGRRCELAQRSRAVLDLHPHAALSCTAVTHAATT